ncbi:hypothetical protein [Paraburkholderia caffeinilytica]|uniref:Uncharacterized protein n=1 Tax=Paraburkholderia caffeinilytica TaxID=1761016 RepID=A0ABQ1NFF5_9BURK|nr:hypothetical protein [Paraburkholderia caffeinilytica]GGC57622.1 hypothetical protein GCM10011400_51600 [Paraburkholderia caffeinilytica]CAB3804848.1 hypothetical protein LMG28690_06101 [Paraburkholderia caffeinilytica]
MEKPAARTSARRLLLKILETQPNLMQFNGGPQNRGDDAANFCIKFIETYSDWLLKNPVQD